ncbi:MAG: hypothetical protein JW720_16165 [Sedimentisphaerales bacterium]|nr:hypothetical protein [Sedimentisphaerales bacterium]
MVARAKGSNRQSGTSLISTMVAVAIITIAVIGTSRLRFYSALDSRRAAMHITAGRAAEMLCESWRAVKGAETYNPSTLLISDLGLAPYRAIAGTPEEGGFTCASSYKLRLNDADYYATLSWKDVAPGLRALNVAVAWAKRNGEEADSSDCVFRLTTYTETN